MSGKSTIVSQIAPILKYLERKCTPTKKKKKKDRKAETDTHLSCSCEIYFDKITDFFLRLKDARGGEVLSIILTLVYYWCYSTDFGRIRNSQFHTGI